MSEQTSAAELRARYTAIMSARSGETEDDAHRRRAFTSWHDRCETIERRRAGVVRANEVLTAHGVTLDDRIAMIRLSLPAWASWLAAEVVHGRQPAEQWSINDAIERAMGRDD